MIALTSFLFTIAYLVSGAESSREKGERWVPPTPVQPGYDGSDQLDHTNNWGDIPDPLNPKQSMPVKSVGSDSGQSCAWPLSSNGHDLLHEESDGYGHISWEDCKAKAEEAGVHYFAWTGEIYGGYCKVLKPEVSNPDLSHYNGYGNQLYEKQCGCRKCIKNVDPGCTHGNADDAWCDANCRHGINEEGCPASHCYCYASHEEHLTPTTEDSMPVKSAGSDCVTIATGGADIHNADGYVQVTVNGVTEVAQRFFEKGEVVLQRCYEKINSFSVQNTDEDGWIGILTMSRDGLPTPLICESCTGLGFDYDFTHLIVVDGNSDLAANDATYCQNGAVCHFTPDRQCRECVQDVDPGCTHGNADAGWCDPQCPNGINEPGCPASHCFCYASHLEQKATDALRSPVKSSRPKKVLQFPRRYYSDESALINIYDIVEKIMMEVTGASDVTPSTTFRELQMDISDLVRLFAAIEEEFGITIPNNDKLRFRTVQDIVHFTYVASAENEETTSNSLMNSIETEAHSIQTHYSMVVQGFALVGLFTLFYMAHSQCTKPHQLQTEFEAVGQTEI